MRKKKFKGPIYAVVDLETTGTNFNNGDRIIQIGAVLVQDGQVINRFSTKVNPCQAIPHSIEQLTGISNQAVKDAPLFEDVAGTIFSLLSGTIFVAHNVNFDFPFLNHQLEQAGYPELSISAIDTVTLSQILYPTAKSFRLRDLTTYLGIEHDQPHTASSDADATAQLLIDLLKRLQSLPTLTLRQLVKMKLALPRQTADVFATELGRRQNAPVRLAEQYYVSHGLVLHKRRTMGQVAGRVDYHYPMTKKAKEKLFGRTLNYRPVQSRMMNAIYNHYQRDSEKYLVVEAATGTGKTLGYLLPLIYHAYPDRRVVISTATNLLQQQIAQKTIQQLNQILPFEISSVVIKGSNHYIDLAKFAHSLAIRDDSKLVQLLKARLLVWLIDTTSGDLDELNLTSQKSPYFTEIRHHGVRSLDPANAFYNDDFLVGLMNRQKYANVVITNHSYLADHAADLGDVNGHPYLVIDEAQHLSDTLIKRSRKTISFQGIMTAVHVLQGAVGNGNERTLTEAFEDLPIGEYNVELLQNDLHDVEEAVTNFQQALYRQFMMKVDSASADRIIEEQVDNDQLANMLAVTNPLMMHLEQSLASVRLHFRELEHLFISRQGSWLPSDRYLMTQFHSHLQCLTDVDQVLHDFNLTLKQRSETAAFWLTIQQSHERSTMKLSGGLLESNHFLSEQVYPYFTNPLFVGATLLTSSRSAYIYRQLDLTRDETRVKRFRSPYDFAHNTKLLIASDAPTPTSHNNSDYIHYLSQTIHDLADETQCQTMILFNSLLTIEQVYSQLRGTDLFNQRDILAQGVTGNRDKLLKQFTSGSRSVLLGAASFWEGIDLPDKQLQLLVITRLPFDSPNELLNRAQYQLMQKSGKNPFYQLQLPKATLKLRQGIGRLLRDETDYGIAVCLDPRLQNRRYGQTMQRALPKEMPKKVASTAEISREAKKFLKLHHPSAKNK